MHEVQAGFRFAEKAGPGIWTAVRESMKAERQAYQLSQGGREGYAYVVNGVKFDAFESGKLIEAKSGYDSFVKAGSGELRSTVKVAQKLLSQAERQLQAAGDKVKIEWRVDSAKAANAIRKLFAVNNISIDVVVAEKTCSTGTHICR